MKLRPSWLAVWLAALFVWLIALAAAWLFHWPVWVHFALIGTGFTHAVLGWVMACREERRKRWDGCPICGGPVDEYGNCPKCGVPDEPLAGTFLLYPHELLAGTFLLCPHCGTPLRDGKCPRGCEECPTCGSLLIDGVCPNADASVHWSRCPECGKIHLDGECPKGHGARPLILGWSGEKPPPMSPFSLEVVEAPVHHDHERCELPETVVIGRDFREATGAYIQLRFADAAQRQSCSRNYVKLVWLPDENVVRVTLMAAVNFAVVDGKRLSGKGNSAMLREGELLELNPGYRLRLVRTESGGGVQ